VQCGVPPGDYFLINNALLVPSSVHVALLQQASHLSNYQNKRSTLDASYKKNQINLSTIIHIFVWSIQKHYGIIFIY